MYVVHNVYRVVSTSKGKLRYIVSTTYTLQFTYNSTSSMSEGHIGAAMVM